MREDNVEAVQRKQIHYCGQRQTEGEFIQVPPQVADQLDNSQAAAFVLSRSDGVLPNIVARVITTLSPESPTQRGQALDKLFLPVNSSDPADVPFIDKVNDTLNNQRIRLRRQYQVWLNNAMNKVLEGFVVPGEEPVSSLPPQIAPDMSILAALLVHTQSNDLLTHNNKVNTTAVGSRSQVESKSLTIFKPKIDTPVEPYVEVRVKVVGGVSNKEEDD